MIFYIAGSLTGIGGMLMLVAALFQGHAPMGALVFAGIVGFVMVVAGIAVAGVEDARSVGR